MNGDIVITITIKPMKGGKRPVIVSAAPAGEMPLILTGHFPERYSLIDSAYQLMLTRKPQTVKVAAVKVAPKKKVAAKPQSNPKGEELEDEVPAAEESKPDQLDQEPLPTIEGDAEGGEQDA